MRYILKNTKELFIEYAVVCVQDFYSLFDNDCEYELSITDNLLDATTFRSIDKAFEIRELVCENPHDWKIVLFGEACGFKTLKEARCKRNPSKFETPVGERRMLELKLIPYKEDEVG